MATNTKYIAPSLRNKARITPNDDFPALTNKTKTNSGSQWKHSFASLATQWKVLDEEETEKREFREAIEKREAERRESELKNIVLTRKRHIDAIYEEDNEYLSEENDDTSFENNDGWTVVERKIRRELTEEERLAREHNQENVEQKENEQSVWNTNNENDDWDYRDRRSHT